MNEIPLPSVTKLFQDWSGERVTSIAPLPDSGSERKYFRIMGGEKRAIGVYHPVPEETAAFLAFSGHFRESGLNVPGIYGTDPASKTYLVEDLGDLSLFRVIRESADFSKAPFVLLKKSLSSLIRFQVEAGKTLDYSFCYPRPSFDAQSVAWDLNYFKYNFLKLKLLFHEQKLEDDFRRLTGFLLSAPADYFMYRDFQSRNIMVRDGEPWFIDYQGGRRGPLPYDVASLLFQVRAQIPDASRELLEQHYCEALAGHGIDPELEFRPYYHAFVLIRLLQVLGAYGFRGLIQRRTHFLESIPYAISRLQWWLSHAGLPFDIPELTRVLEKLATETRFPESESARETGQLKVEVRSFAYKEGIPVDYSGHGGGFVFDCRALPNPGREERYRPLSGKDPAIVLYLGQNPEVTSFLDSAFRLVDHAVETYITKGFTHLSVAFGCTGGQHRSVFCAEEMAGYLVAKFPAARITLQHTELEKEDNPGR